MCDAQDILDGLAREVKERAAVQSGKLTDEQRERVRDAIAEALGDALDCARVWSAWSYGTMGPDDFAIVAEDESRLSEIVDAAIDAVLAVQGARNDSL